MVSEDPVRHSRAAVKMSFSNSGYSSARSGAHGWAVVYEAGVELPSDMSGVLYTVLDPGGGWKLELARELRAAGVSVDTAKLL